MIEDELKAVETACLDCRECGLCAERHNVVFSAGNPHSQIMFIGEGPGEQEDLQGVPFVGAAGQLLDKMLEMIDLDRSKVYIANMVKCRPPKNRDPREEELAACRHWLERQIAFVQPRLIVCLGRISAMALIDSEFRITRQHGLWFQRGPYDITATYHPSALLRDVNKRPEAFCDLRSIRQKIRECCTTYSER